MADLEKRLSATTTEKLAILLQLADADKDLVPAKRLQYAQLALELARQQKDRRSEARSLFLAAGACLDANQTREAIAGYTQAGDIYDALNLPHEKFDCLKNTGTVYENAGDYDRALTCYQQALQQSKGIPFEKGTGVALIAGDGTWNYQLGIAYASGINDIKDFYEKEYSTPSMTVSPIGFVFTPYYEWKSGLRICGDLGPIIAVMGDVHFTDVPVGVSVGYAFLPSESVSPYVRAGARHHIASGDRMDSSQPGGFAAFGVDFNQKARVHFGFEAAVDTSIVKFKSENDQVWNPVTNQYESVISEIKPNKFMLNIHVSF